MESRRGQGGRPFVIISHRWTRHDPPLMTVDGLIATREKKQKRGECELKIGATHPTPSAISESLSWHGPEAKEHGEGRENILFHLRWVNQFERVLPKIRRGRRGNGVGQKCEEGNGGITERTKRGVVKPLKAAI